MPELPPSVARRPLAVVDIDGVVADVRHRLHHVERQPKDWKGFFAAAKDDGLHAEGLALVRVLEVEHDIVFLTGRPEHLRRDTEQWLGRHGMGGHRLLMRGNRDQRPAAKLKVEVLARLSSEADVALVVDDDARVIDAASTAGYAVLHAEWEARARDRDQQAALLEAQEDDGRT